MLRHPCIEKLTDKAVAAVLAMLLTVLILPVPASAAADSGMQQSLSRFFDHGVALRGATAELIKVERWPDAKGAMRWSLPNVSFGHPSRLSMIAEQNGKRWYVPVRVHWWAKAVTINVSIPARSLLSKGMLKLIRTDIANHSGQWWNDASDVDGMRTTRPLHKGDVIFSSYVRRPPLIKRGDIVTIMLDTGSIRIRTEGKALRQASRGDRLLVQNMRSNETIQAIAEGRGLVRVNIQGI